MRPLHFALIGIVAVLSLFVSSQPVSIGYGSEAKQAGLSPYIVQLAEPEVALLVDDTIDQRLQEIYEGQRLQVEQVISQLGLQGQAGSPTYDAETRTFNVDLTPQGKATLEADPNIASIEPTAPATSLQSLKPEQITLQEVSSVNYVQVYSPFMWGKVSKNGLSVSARLLESDGTTVKGVAIQTFDTPPGIKISNDPREPLYFETLFVNPGNKDNLVLIMPGDIVEVIVEGEDFDGQFKSWEKEISVVDVRAWTSYDGDTVSGYVDAPAGSDVIVTAGSLNLSNYVTPGTTLQYATTTTNSSKGFSVSGFHTTDDGPYKTVDLKKGSTGFVRYKKADGNEIYTVHGQNVFVLENSYLVHGYSFGLPSAPAGVPTEFRVPRTKTAPTVAITLKNESGTVTKASTSFTHGSTAQYQAILPASIQGGDQVEVSINQAPPIVVKTKNLTADVKVGQNQITGTGPANKSLTLAVGRIAGYFTKNSTANFLTTNVTTNGSGAYATGQIICRGSNYLDLAPGSFGYLGYEDEKGNFIYSSFAAPVSYVMSDFPYVEGWVANGNHVADITVRAPNTSINKSALTATPVYIRMMPDQIHVNLFYYTTTSQFIEPGDSVRVASGGRVWTIPVDNIKAYVNTDQEFINGIAPAGAKLRVVPADDRSIRQEVVAGANGSWVAGNPFTTFSVSTCSESSKNKTFDPGAAGRVYYQHADGNEVFAVYGRSMHVNENENVVELYQYVLQDIDFLTMPKADTRQATATLTRSGSSPVTVTEKPNGSRSGKTILEFTDSGGQRVLIRAGDNISITFDEGPADGPTRPVTLQMNNLALLTGSPDLETNLVGGLGPVGWGGLGTLKVQNTTYKTLIPASSTTVYQPLRFTKSNGDVVNLQFGYAGTVSFTNSTGNRLWTAWAVTSFPVKIKGWLMPGQTTVCGTAAANVTVRIHDVTTEGKDIVIGTGTSDGQGNFCVTVPALQKGQVIVAEADGTYSQPKVVGNVVFMPTVPKQAG